jgi:hypothetical protein
MSETFKDLSKEDQELFLDHKIEIIPTLLEGETLDSYSRNTGCDFFDCGQGFYTEKATLICYTQDEKFYRVHLSADIGSSKQDRGDRLYWVEDIKEVLYNEIPKPLPIEKKEYTFSAILSKKEKAMVDMYLENLKKKTY